MHLVLRDLACQIGAVAATVVYRLSVHCTRNRDENGLSLPVDCRPMTTAMPSLTASLASSAQVGTCKTKVRLTFK